ncbi:hypothetical protein ACSBR1_023715 [Camellia fascicularis]
MLMQVVALGGDKLGGCRRPNCIKGSQVKGASCDYWTFVLESMGEPRNSQSVVILCWKVWVNHVTVNVSSFRSTHEMYDLKDAIGSTVAWPSQFILLN